MKVFADIRQFCSHALASNVKILFTCTEYRRSPHGSGLDGRVLTGAISFLMCQRQQSLRGCCDEVQDVLMTSGVREEEMRALSPYLFSSLLLWSETLELADSASAVEEARELLVEKSSYVCLASEGC